MHPPRFRLRTLMIGVAFWGVWLGLGIMFLQKIRIGSLAAHWAYAEECSLRDAAWNDEQALKWGEAFRRRAEMMRRRAEYQAALKRKYEAATVRPWLPVAPDPPPPE